MTLAKAIAAFIASNGDRSVMDIPAWAKTYRCEPDAIRAAYETQMTKHSLTQQRNCEEHEGK